MDDDGFRQRYRDLVKAYSDQFPRDHAMRIAVGGEFEAVGILERQLLIQHGLRPDGYLIDVGCGSGRLAKALAEYLRGKYLGIDVVRRPDRLRAHVRQTAELALRAGGGISHSRGGCAAPMWSASSPVFTHLLHEHSYLYLCEAKRVLKPGGKIVLSFLEFANALHWGVFEQALRDASVRRR